MARSSQKMDRNVRNNSDPKFVHDKKTSRKEITWKFDIFSIVISAVCFCGVWPFGKIVTYIWIFFLSCDICVFLEEVTNAQISPARKMKIRQTTFCNKTIGLLLFLLCSSFQEQYMLGQTRTTIVLDFLDSPIRVIIVIFSFGLCNFRINIASR